MNGSLVQGHLHIAKHCPIFWNPTADRRRMWYIHSAHTRNRTHVHTRRHWMGMGCGVETRRIHTHGMFGELKSAISSSEWRSYAKCTHSPGAAPANYIKWLWSLLLFCLENRALCTTRSSMCLVLMRHPTQNVCDENRLTINFAGEWRRSWESLRANCTRLHWFSISTRHTVRSRGGFVLAATEKKQQYRGGKFGWAEKHGRHISLAISFNRWTWTYRHEWQWMGSHTLIVCIARMRSIEGDATYTLQTRQARRLSHSTH